MPDPVWYRSLYWRVALSFVALLATMLVVQGLVFLWMTGRMQEYFPSRSAAQFALTIATDLETVLADTPDTDLDTYLNDKYGGSFRPFAVATLDGRNILSRGKMEPPPNMLRSARMRLFGGTVGDRRIGQAPGGPPPGAPRLDGPPPGPPGPPSPDSPPFDGGGRGRGGDRGGRGFGFGPGRGPSFAFAPAIVDGQIRAMVAVPTEPPPLSIAVRDLGPWLAVVALVLLGAGTAAAALVVFRPTRRRLRALQDAARALGEGQSGVRAPDTGRDEVASLARTFNEMAGQLEDRTHALEQADRIRRQLLADVSHELTTPLASIRGYVETLAMTDLQIDDATRARYLSIVTEESERLEHIIGDLLDLARLEGGGGSMRVEQVSLAGLLARVRHRHDPVVNERGITLETTRDPAIDVIAGDSNRLEQALQNLVANAVRHTPVGGRVTVVVARVADGVSIAVADTGPGISPEHLPRIFDRFYKVDESRTGTATPSGSGLGLSIVRAIVTRHGGSVTVGNLEEGGARFEIVLPIGERRDG